MKHFTLALCLFLPLFSFAQGSTEYRKISSLTEWLDEIDNWPEPSYEVERIRVSIDYEKDSLYYGIQWKAGRDSTIKKRIIDKAIRIDDFYIEGFFGGPAISYGIKNIQFDQEVRFRNFRGILIAFNDVVFNDYLGISGAEDYVYYNFISCDFNAQFQFFDLDIPSRVYLIEPRLDLLFFTRSTGAPEVEIVNGEANYIRFGGERLSELTIDNMAIEDLNLQNTIIEETASITNNSFKSVIATGTKFPDDNTYFPFDQISGKLYAQIRKFGNQSPEKYFASDTMDFDQKENYDQLIGSYKVLQDKYQKRGDQDSYNACYVEMKNLETRRLAHIYRKDPSFKSFFTWKINQFLKTFSAYGTEPARAIIFSFYVIIAFALIYLLFPNHWDSHGKNRIMDRYRFFLKYVNRDSGIHEVYLDEKKPELLASEDFKFYLEEQGKTAPKFFMATALPLYRWSVAGTKTFSWFLSKVDVLNGTWSTTEDSKKAGKSVLIIGAFLIALLYDILIKILNALMLSINTFTTLGFGEIPIKGLPRYLAIIQGFIGWFMLTIFSVSLISQLLN
ncbi:MAG: two pore domain potassium channel family protein [Cyclobacteriaceae bacterium]|nr:two pore domain potassium channel family protein [Cyclobacteriaceae bacterium]